jgi:D-alanyl-D-alanine carboxypeptidase (penicillin-binding protein 5/6)
MLPSFIQIITISTLIMNGALIQTPPLDISTSEQIDLVHEFSMPWPEDVGFKRNPEHISPVLASKAALAIDMETGAVLYSRKPSTRIPIASITKVMTALVVLDEKGDSLQEVAKVPVDAHSVDGTRSWIKTENHYSIDDLLAACLISSAADATFTLADHVGGTRDNFVIMMNKKAHKMGLTGLSFDNPVGLDNENNYGTALDVALMYRELLKNEHVRELMNNQIYMITSQEGQKTQLETTNSLLKNSGFDIVNGKTGTTDDAGQTFVTIGSTAGGRETLVVILGSTNRWQDAKTLLAWCEVAWSKS